MSLAKIDAPRAVARWKKSTTVLFTLCTLPLLGACEWITGISEPDNITIQIGSTDLNTATLILSTWFLRVPNPECPDTCEAGVQLVVSDTMSITVPYDETLPFTSRQQYFVEVYPTLPDTADMSMRVIIDGREWMNEQRNLIPSGVDGEQETLRFVFQFSTAAPLGGG